MLAMITASFVKTPLTMRYAWLLLASINLASCSSEPVYAALKNEPCTYGLTVVNNANNMLESILLVDNAKHLCGDITLQYYGKLKIVAKGNLYLDEVIFLNTSKVEILANTSEKDIDIKLPPVHIWLFNVGAPRFYIHNVESVSLLGDIVSCNSFELQSVANIHANNFDQLLSDELVINLASSIEWNGAVSSCKESESKKISISASNEINFLASTKLISSDLSISGSANMDIAGLFASTSSLSVQSRSLNFFGAKVKFTGILAEFKSKNFIANSDSFFDLRNAKIEARNVVINGNISCNGTLTLKAYSESETGSTSVDVSGASLYGSRLVFQGINNVKATKKSISGTGECIWESKTVNLHGDLEWVTRCQLISDVITVKSCNFTRPKGSVMKAKSLELVIDGDDCPKLYFSSHGIIDISGDTVMTMPKAGEIDIGVDGILKTGSLMIVAKSSDMQCLGCRIIVNDENVSTMQLKKLTVTSDWGLKVDFKDLPQLSNKRVFDCYEPVFVSERCTVRNIASNGKNLFVTQVPYYTKISSVLIEGSLNLDIPEIVVKNAAFVVDGKLKFLTQVDKLTVEATKGCSQIMLAPLNLHSAVRSSSGTGRIVKGEYSLSNLDPLQYFNKYDVAHDFKLISASERDECKRGESSKQVYCPIYFEGSSNIIITRKSDGLQSIFHAKSYDGATVSGLRVGVDVLDLDKNFTMPDMDSISIADKNNEWSNEVARHRTLLKESGLITSLENMKDAISSEVQSAISGVTKVAVLERLRLSGEIALNSDNLGAYKIYSSDEMEEISKKALPGSPDMELLWNVLDYPKSTREFLQDDEVILKLFKCTGLEFPVVSMANQNLMQDLLNDLIFATLGKLKGISSARLLEHLVDNTCAIFDKLEALGAKPGTPLDRKQKELFEVPGVWPFWLSDCLGGHSSCISLELALNEKSIEKMLPSGAKLNADEHITLDGTRLELGMSGNIIAGKSIDAKLVGDTRVDGRILASKITTHIDGNLKNVGIISGENVQISAKNVINLGKIEATKGLAFQALGNFIAAGFVTSEGTLSLEVAHKLTLLSLKEVALFESTGLKVVSQNVAHITSIIAKGALEMSAGGDILNIGAEVVGESVFISTSEKIVSVPLELYNEVVEAGKYYYKSYKGATYIKPTIMATGEKEEDSKSANSNFSSKAVGNNAPALIEKEIARIKNKAGTVVIRGKKDVQIIGTDISGTDDVALLSDEGGISVKSIKPWKEITITTRGEDLLNEWEDTNYDYDEQVDESNIKSGGTLHSYSLKDQEWVGVSIKVTSIRLAAGTPEHKASIALLPMQKTKVIKVESKSGGFALKLQRGGVSFYDEEHRGSGTFSTKQIPTIIELEDEFLGYASGKFTIIDPALIDRSEDERGNIHVKISAEEINLEAAPEIEASYSFMDKHGIGVGFSVDGGEFAVKGCVFGESYKKDSFKKVYKRPKPFRGWIELNAKTFKDAGVAYFAQALHINAETEIHGIVMNEENEAEVRALVETGIKFGIKSNFGAIVGSGKNIADRDYSRPEGLINTAFEGYKLYTDVLKLLSSGHGLSGGAWVYMKAEETSKESKASQSVPTLINVRDLKMKSSDLHLLGTQIEAYRGYIEAKYLRGRAAKTTTSYDTSGKFLDTEIFITAPVPPNIQGLIQKATEKSEFYLNANIYVSDRLTMKIDGKADLKGVSISAGKLEANFNELVLESLQNVIESGGLSSSLGGGVGSDSFNIGHHIQDRSRHVVDSLTMILGRESAHIVVAEALRMNGALIANAERDRDGKFTDHGNLTLKVGELFVQHIYDYDNGVTLGAAVSYTGSNKYGKSYVDVMPTFGSFEKDGITRSTLGKGNVEVGSCKLGEDFPGNDCEELSKSSHGKESLNRDTDKVQEFTTHHNIEPIHAYFTTMDVDQLKTGNAWNEDGSIDFARATKSLFDTVVKLLLPEKIETKRNKQAKEEAEEDAGKEITDEETELDTEEHGNRDDIRKASELVEEELSLDEEELTTDNKAEILVTKISEYLKERYGEEKAAVLMLVCEEALKKRLNALENIEDNQYTIDGNNLIVKTSFSISHGLDIELPVKNSDVMEKGHKNFKAGKKIGRFTSALMLLDEIYTYLSKPGRVEEASAFAEETLQKLKDLPKKLYAEIRKTLTRDEVKGKAMYENKLKMAGKGTMDPGQNPDGFEPDDKETKGRIDDSKFQEARYKGKLEYEDAEYHHRQSRGSKSHGKSPSPESKTAAMNALKRSVRIKETSDVRVGVDVENEEFIVFRRHDEHMSDGNMKFHGHVTSWKELENDFREALIKSGLAKRNGKIVPKPE